jgi:2-C-methyl-D-erythritol 4-phosphate cytidylyltransferase
VNYWLIIPAAGSGRRFGAAKQHAPLAGATVLDWALRTFLGDSRCRGGVIALSPGDAERGALRARLPTRFNIVDGGAQRAQSVLQGLDALRAQSEDWVLVHDAARPCLSVDDLERLLSQAPAGEGGLLAAPVADTVKQAMTPAPATAGAGAPADLRRVDTALPRVATTLPRETLWLAQTPQMFRHGALRSALAGALAAGRMPTDEAQAMEWRGAQPALVEARDGNPKVTTNADLWLAEVLLKKRSHVDHR